MSGAEPTIWTSATSTQVPEAAVMPERAAKAPVPGTQIPSHYRWCYGCGSDHPSGLHMKLFAGPGLTTEGRFLVTDMHQGSPGLAHGGLLTTAMDEVLGSLNWLLDTPAVTAHLECDFRRPVPVGSELAMRAQVDGAVGRRIFMSAVALIDDRPAVSARAVFVQVPIEHFTAHGNPEHVEQAIRDRASGGPAFGSTGLQVNP